MVEVDSPGTIEEHNLTFIGLEWNLHTHVLRPKASKLPTIDAELSKIPEELLSGHTAVAASALGKGIWLALLRHPTLSYLRTVFTAIDTGIRTDRHYAQICREIADLRSALPYAEHELGAEYAPFIPLMFIQPHGVVLRYAYMHPQQQAQILSRHAYRLLTPHDPLPDAYAWSQTQTIIAFRHSWYSDVSTNECTCTAWLLCMKWLRTRQVNGKRVVLLTAWNEFTAAVVKGRSSSDTKLHLARRIAGIVIPSRIFLHVARLDTSPCQFGVTSS